MQQRANFIAYVEIPRGAALRKKIGMRITALSTASQRSRLRKMLRWIGAAPFRAYDDLAESIA